MSGFAVRFGSLFAFQTLDSGLFCLWDGDGSGEKGEQEPRVLSMGSVSFAESHIQMDYMRNLTSCLKTNHSLCSNE